MKIVIVDDDNNSLERLRNVLVNDYGDIVESVEAYNNPLSFINSKSEFDLLFLDIEMPQMTGIELSKNKLLLGANIVFVTAKESLVFDAYNETNAIGFIRKLHLKEDLSIIMQKLTSKDNSSKAILVKREKGIVKLFYDDILYIENQSNDIVIHTRHGNYSKRYKISDLEKELMDSGFIRCHLGFIVNLRFIEYIGDKDITLEGGERIPISRKRIKLVKEKFLRINGV